MSQRVTRFPPCETQHRFEEESLIKYCWVARNLLEGNMFDYFKAAAKYYIQSPQVIKVSNLHPMVQGLVNRLKNAAIDTIDKLTKSWSQDREYAAPALARQPGLTQHTLHATRTPRTPSTPRNTHSTQHTHSTPHALHATRTPRNTQLTDFSCPASAPPTLRRFLWSEFSQWIKPESRSSLKKQWPPKF